MTNVVIFGRTNVGKSTLFNKLTEKERALATPIEGTTRDVNIGEVFWNRKKFTLIDTGGIMDLKYLTGKKVKTDTIEEEVQKQTRLTLKRANLILFIVDGKTGILPQDREMVVYLKRIAQKNKKIILVVNKMDSPKLRKELSDFYRLGLGEPIAISSTTGSGTGDLLDIIIKEISSSKYDTEDDKKEDSKTEEEKKEEKQEKKKEISISIIGRPNVGKSSLLNSILGEKRVIVSPIPHTTREPQDTFMQYKNNNIRIIDTAGITKKGAQKAYGKKDKHNLEKKGIERSIATIGRSNIVLFVIDVSSVITHQDARIIEEIIKRKKSLIIIANKWDLVPEKDTKKYTDYIYTKFPFIAWAPIQYTSALTGEKVKKILDLTIKINEVRKKEITDSQANTFLMKIIKIHKPAKGKGVKHPHIHKFRQIKSNPPVFELRIGSKDDLHFSYVRFIQNRIREKFDIIGTPITIRVIKNRQIHGKHE